MDFGNVTAAPPDAKATPGDIKQIVKHMSNSLGDVQSQICGFRSMLMMLEVGQSQQLVICRAGGIQAVVAAMNAHEQSAELQCHAALVLASLAHGNREAQTLLIASNAVEALTSCVAEFPAAEELTASAAVALAAISQDFSDGVAQVCSAGGHTAVMAAMAHIGDGLVQERGCELLAVLAAMGCGEAVHRCGGLDAVLKALLQLQPNADVQVAGCIALEEFAKVLGEDQMSDVECCSCVDAAIHAMRAHTDNARLQESACRALAAVLDSRCKVACARCFEMSGAEVVTASVQTATLKGKVRPRAAFHVLACLASEEDCLSSMVMQSGGVRAIVEAMETRPKDKIIQECGFLALQRIGRAPGLDAVLDADGISAIRRIASVLPKLSALANQFVHELEQRAETRFNVAEMD